MGMGQAPAGGSIVPVRQTEAEVFLATVRDVVDALKSMRVAEMDSQNRQIESNERIVMRSGEIAERIGGQEHRLLLAMVIVSGILAVVSFWASRPDLGYALGASTITAILGYLAGRRGQRLSTGGTNGS